MKKSILVLAMIAIMTLFILTACEEGALTGEATLPGQTFDSVLKDDGGKDNGTNTTETDFFVELVSVYPENPELGDTVVMSYSYGNNGPDGGYATKQGGTWWSAVAGQTPEGGDGQLPSWYEAGEVRNGTTYLTLDQGLGEYGMIQEMIPQVEEWETNLDNNEVVVTFFFDEIQNNLTESVTFEVQGDDKIDLNDGAGEVRVNVEGYHFSSEYGDSIFIIDGVYASEVWVIEYLGNIEIWYEAGPDEAWAQGETEFLVEVYGEQIPVDILSANLEYIEYVLGIDVTIDYEDDEIDLNDGAGEQRDDADGFVYSTYQSIDAFIVDGAYTSEVYAIDHYGYLEIWYEDGDDEAWARGVEDFILVRNGTEFVITPPGEVAPVTNTSGPVEITLIIEHDDGIDLHEDGSNGTSVNNEEGLHFISNLQGDFFQVGGVATEEVWVIDNYGETQIWYEAGEYEVNSGESEFVIMIDEEEIVVVPPEDITANIIAFNYSLAWQILFGGGSNDVLYFFIDVDYDFFGMYDDDEQDELRYSITGDFYDGEGIGREEYDYTTHYGVVIPNPSDQLEAGGSLDMVIPFINLNVNDYKKVCDDIICRTVLGLGPDECDSSAECQLIDDCTDSDGGWIYDVFGIVTVTNGSNSYAIEDFCVGDEIHEYSCAGNYPASSIQSCSALGYTACVDGACVSGNQTPPISDFYAIYRGSEPENPLLGQTLTMHYTYGNYGPDTGNASVRRGQSFPGGGGGGITPDQEFVAGVSMNGSMDIDLVHGLGRYGVQFSLSASEGFYDPNMANNVAEVYFNVTEATCNYAGGDICGPREACPGAGWIPAGDSDRCCSEQCERKWYYSIAFWLP